MRNVAICVLLAILLLGCTSQPAGQPPGGNNTTSGTNEVFVQISGFKFQPADLVVAVGTKVTWVNNDQVLHSIASDTGVFDLGDFQHSENRSYVFNTPGVYAYHCRIHPTMQGNVTVT